MSELERAGQPKFYGISAIKFRWMEKNGKGFVSKSHLFGVQLDKPDYLPGTWSNESGGVECSLWTSLHQVEDSNATTTCMSPQIRGFVLLLDEPDAILKSSATTNQVLTEFSSQAILI